MLARGGRSIWRSLSQQPALVRIHQPAFPQRTVSFWNRFLAIKNILLGGKQAEPKQAQPAIDTQTLMQALHKHEPSILHPERRDHHHVQEETTKSVINEERLRSLTKQASHNLSTWSRNRRPSPFCVEVVEDDWGVVAQKMTKKYGHIYAILNMANPDFVGGDFLGGGSAQEENMYARTSCARHIITEGASHIYLHADFTLRYKEEMSDLINGKTPMSPSELQKLSAIYGREIAKAYKVYLNTTRPEVCFRGPEIFMRVTDSSFFDDGQTREYRALNSRDGSFSYLKEDQIFPFYELRSAALDLTESTLKVNWRDEDFLAWFRKETKKRIDAQLDTALLYDVRHVALCAFGCGSFRNKASEVAKLYRQALEERAVHFEHVVFAIYYPGFGTNNFPDFAKELEGLALGRDHTPVKTSKPRV